MSRDTGRQAQAPVVLMAEDDLDFRGGYELYLRSCGLVVEVASSGPEVLERVAAAAPDVVLLDMELPGLDGWHTAQALRAGNGPSSLAIIAFTGHVYPEHRQRAHEIGCDGFLAKPSSPDEVLLEISRVLAIRWTSELGQAGRSFEVAPQRYRPLHPHGQERDGTRPEGARLLRESTLQRLTLLKALVRGDPAANRES